MKYNSLMPGIPRHLGGYSDIVKKDIRTLGHGTVMGIPERLSSEFVEIVLNMLYDSNICKEGDIVVSEKRNGGYCTLIFRYINQN